MQVVPVKSTSMDVCGSFEIAACQHLSSSMIKGPANRPSMMKHVVSGLFRVVILSISAALSSSICVGAFLCDGKWLAKQPETVAGHFKFLYS
jgi:hypothetical protein